MTLLTFTLRLLAALLLGGAVGAERQWRQRSAGLRTNTLVSMGSAAFVLLSIKIGGDATGRIASYIVSGIGFLGAGVIMKDGLSVRGLNTAATIWCSASVGALCGLGMATEAAVLCALIILVHIVFRPLGQKLGSVQTVKNPNSYTDYTFTVVCRQEVENHVRVMMMQHLASDKNAMLKSLSSDDDGNPERAISRRKSSPIPTRTPLWSGLRTA